MPEATPLSPELARSVSLLARSLVAAARTWSLYPPEHPAVQSSLERLRAAIAEASSKQGFAFSVTPETLLVAGVPAPARDGVIGEVAAWLHQRDILEMSFLADVPVSALQSLLALLAEDITLVRARGGPAKAWMDGGHSSIGIQQIDFVRVLEDRETEPPARRKDDLWRAIVRAITERRQTVDEAIQRRLLEIAGDIGAIGELAQDVMAPNFAADGSPMLTSQAAAVIAAYRHLVGIVEVMSPDRRTEVMQNIANATANLDPRVIMHMLTGPEEEADTGGISIKRGLADAFDDVKVAQLLATTLAIDGQASDRLAEVFDTIAPDEPRKRRVLTLARSLLSETSFGKTNQFRTLWTSMEELLLTYNERPFVSAEYRAGLDDIGARAETMAGGDTPAEFLPLIETLQQENVRRLSIALLIDLLRLEQDATRAPELARDVAALCEDLLLAGDYEGALAVTTALAEQAANRTAVVSSGCRVALDNLVQTPAFHEAVEMFGEMSDAEAALFSKVCEQAGPASIDVLQTQLDVEEFTASRHRATAVIRSFGPRAVKRLAPLVANGHWYAQRTAADLLGEIGSADAVPLLQPLLRGSDPRVTRAAVRALSSIDDPAAARAVHTVLRAASGAQREAVVAALVAERDPRVVPVLARILNESDALGADHPIVLQTLGAVAEIGGDQAIPAIVTVMQRRRWFARKRARVLKQASLDTLCALHSPAAEAALKDAADHGDRMLRKLVRALPGRVPSGDARAAATSGRGRA